MKKLIIYILFISSLLYGDHIGGDGKEYSEAAGGFKKSCDSANALGCFHLGLYYANGQSVTQDYPMAKLFYGKACDLGSQKGCTNYNYLHKKGY